MGRDVDRRALALAVVVLVPSGGCLAEYEATPLGTRRSRP
jgi:hypothetical protein